MLNMKGVFLYVAVRLYKNLNYNNELNFDMHQNMQNSGSILLKK